MSAFDTMQCCYTVCSFIAMNPCDSLTYSVMTTFSPFWMISLCCFPQIVIRITALSPPDLDSKIVYQCIICKIIYVHLCLFCLIHSTSFQTHLNSCLWALVLAVCDNNCSVPSFWDTDPSWRNKNIFLL